jgi:hypothetical protein
MLKQMFGDDKLQNGVTEEFQTLIIKMVPLCFVPETGMSERLGQQKRIAELITDAFLEWTHITVFDKSRVR